MNDEELRTLCTAIVESEDQDLIYNIYDGKDVGDRHELWLACVRYRKIIEALENELAP